MGRVLIFLFLLFALTVKSQNTLWKEVPKSHLKSKSKQVRPSKYKAYRLDLQLLREKLEKSPEQRANINLSTVILDFPDESGILKKYKIAEASVMDRGLQENHLEIRSYIGKSIDNSNSIIRFSISPYGGFNGIILNQSISPTLIKRKGNYYHIFLEKDIPAEENSFECGVVDEVESRNRNYLQKKRRKTLIGGKLRTYRLALATTGEYSNYVLDELNISSTASDYIKKNAILGHLNSVMTTVNAVFERDVNITMQLVTNNTDIIFLDAITDKLNNDITILSLKKVKVVLDSIILNSNYDIGELLITNGGGAAYLNSVCDPETKALGISNSYIEGYRTLIHEIGHQFGANHTFNHENKGQLNPTTAVEVGFGRTIMSYGGTSRYLFFHSISIEEMKNSIQYNDNCASITNTGNTPPIANAGNDFTIPKSTPFLLGGIVTDPDDSVLTYTWEQIDTEEGIFPLVLHATEGPVFEWLPPTNKPKRYMPRLDSILDGKIKSQWEVVPSVSRQLNFAFCVRDNDERGGETSQDKMRVTVDGNSGPFLITSYNNPTNWYSGQTKTISWDVANTNVGTVNTSTVDILFSTDGGYTYPTTLASNVVNDGSYNLIVPIGIKTTQGRFMIKGHNNIFLDINNANITVEERKFLVNISDAEEEKELCLIGSNSISYNFTYSSLLGFKGTVNFSASNLNGTSITFSPASTNTDGDNITMTVSNISETNIGSNAISITATSGSLSFTNQVILGVYNNTLNTVNLINPSNGAIDISEPFSFQWSAENNANYYRIQIYTNNSFSNSNIVTDTVVADNYFSTLLNYNTTYYWRVKPINTCTNGTFSSTYSFTTQYNDFITTWTTATDKESITFPGTGSYTIDWGDGDISGTVTAPITMPIHHIYDTASTYTVTVSNGITSFSLGANYNNYSAKLTSIKQWGTAKWRKMSFAFFNATNMIYDATDVPHLSEVETMFGMFGSTNNFNGDISSWNVSKITNMQAMFAFASSFNRDISRWNVSNVTNMDNMFYDANAFSQNLGAWYVQQDTLRVYSIAAGTVITSLSAQNSVLSAHNPIYTLTGTDASYFDINENQLVIGSTNLPASKSSYNVTVNVGGSGLFGTANSKILSILKYPDITNPVAPTLTLVYDTGSIQDDNITNRVRINVRGIEEGASWEYKIGNDGQFITGTTADNSSFITENVFYGRNGKDTVIVRQIDLASNISENGKLIFVRDTIIPVIVLNGANPQVINKGLVYIELGATVTDNIDSERKIAAKNSSNVDVRILGRYLITYSAIDIAGNVANEVIRNVDVLPTVNQTFLLNVGWNLVGFNIEPIDNSLSNIFVSVSSLVEIKSHNKSYRPTLPSFLNKLNSLEKGQGYYIRLNRAEDITLTGTSIDLSETSISLSKGWNLISYPSQNTTDIQTALRSIDQHILQVNSINNVYIPSIGSMSTLTQLNPGEGYWIKVSQNCNLTF